MARTFARLNDVTYELAAPLSASLCVTGRSGR